LIFVEAEKFSNIPFDSISKGRRTDLLLHHNPQAMKGELTLLKEKNEALGGSPPSRPHHLSEIVRPANRLFSWKSEKSLHGGPMTTGRMA
jgi:hypothetical protein